MYFDKDDNKKRLQWNSVKHIAEKQLTKIFASMEWDENFVNTKSKQGITLKAALLQSYYTIILKFNLL